MRKTTLSMLAVGAAVGAILIPADRAQAQMCETSEPITIAEMTWLSASTLAYVTQTILNEGYGCEAEVVPGDTVPTATSMLTKSEPTIAPELWVSTAQSIWQEIEEQGNVYAAAPIFADGGQEGWWVPRYVWDDNPSLRSITDLKDHWELFTELTDRNEGRLYGCPPGWGCEIITNNLFAALDLDETFDLFSPGSGANLKASFARKATREEPIVGYYWGPTAVIGRYDLVRLDMPAYDEEAFTCLTDPNCADPQISGWKPGEVVVAVVTTLKDEAPEVAAFLENMTLPNDVVNGVLAWADEGSSSPEEAAAYFFETHEDVWTGWVPADVADRVKASL